MGVYTTRAIANIKRDIVQAVNALRMLDTEHAEFMLYLGNTGRNHTAYTAEYKQVKNARSLYLDNRDKMRAALMLLLDDLYDIIKANS